LIERINDPLDVKVYRNPGSEIQKQGELTSRREKGARTEVGARLIQLKCDNERYEGIRRGRI
jgi:hypothetical protein